MRSALLSKDIIAKAQDIFLKCIDKLNRRLNFHSVGLAMNIDWLMHHFLLAIEVTHIGDNALWLVIGDLLLLTHSLILVVNGQIWIEIGGLVQP